LLVLNVVPLVLLLVDVRTTLARLYPRRELYGLGVLSLSGGLLLPWRLLAVHGVRGLCLTQRCVSRWRIAGKILPNLHVQKAAYEIQMRAVPAATAQ
jgi:hypothetical protein